MGTDQPETILNSDDIPTIPPQPEDLPQVSEPEAEPLPQQWRSLTRTLRFWHPGFWNNVDQAKEAHSLC
jgi:hypothetical protein